MPLDLIGFAAPEKELGLADSATIFPVEARTLLSSTKPFTDESDTPHGVFSESETHKCIVRTDTGRIVGVVGSKYGLLRNETLFSSMEQTMREAIPTEMWEGVQVREGVCRGGAFCRREYVFPAYAEALRNTVHETKLGFRVIVTNSYDGGSSASMQTGLIDFACTNGLVLGKNIAMSSARHSSRLDHRQFVQPLRMAIEQSQEMVDEVRTMARTPITMDQATEFCEKKFSGKRSALMLEQFGREVENRGMNAFALLSALTYYASHDSELFPAPGRRGNTDEVLHYREQEVQTLVGSREFRSLLEAA